MAHGDASARDLGVYKGASLLSNLLFHIILIVAKIFCLRTSSPSVGGLSSLMLPLLWDRDSGRGESLARSYRQNQHQQDGSKPNINSFLKLYLVLGCIFLLLLLLLLRNQVQEVVFSALLHQMLYLGRHDVE